MRIKRREKASSSVTALHGWHFSFLDRKSEWEMIEQSKIEAAIHHRLVRGLTRASPPDIRTLQEIVKADAASVREGLKRLEANHSLVCHPGSGSPWVRHPFSLSPTATWVHADQRGW